MRADLNKYLPTITKLLLDRGWVELNYKGSGNFRRKDCYLFLEDKDIAERVKGSSEIYETNYYQQVSLEDTDSMWSAEYYGILIGFGNFVKNLQNYDEMTASKQKINSVNKFLTTVTLLSDYPDVAAAANIRPTFGPVSDRPALVLYPIEGGMENFIGWTKTFNDPVYCEKLKRQYLTGQTFFVRLPDSSLDDGIDKDMQPVFLQETTLVYDQMTMGYQVAELHQESYKMPYKSYKSFRENGFFKFSYASNEMVNIWIWDPDTMINMNAFIYELGSLASSKVSAINTMIRNKMDFSIVMENDLSEVKLKCLIKCINGFVPYDFLFQDIDDEASKFLTDLALQRYNVNSLLRNLSFSAIQDLYAYKYSQDEEEINRLRSLGYSENEVNGVSPLSFFRSMRSHGFRTEWLRNKQSLHNVLLGGCKHSNQSTPFIEMFIRHGISHADEIELRLNDKTRTDLDAFPDLLLIRRSCIAALSVLPDVPILSNEKTKEYTSLREYIRKGLKYGYGYVFAPKYGLLLYLLDYRLKFESEHSVTFFNRKMERVRCITVIGNKVFDNEKESTVREYVAVSSK